MKRIGIAFDIDGVLYRGGQVFQETFAAFKLLDKFEIPHIFMTNGVSYLVVIMQFGHLI